MREAGVIGAHAVNEEQEQLIDCEAKGKGQATRYQDMAADRRVFPAEPLQDDGRDNQGNGVG